MVGLADDAFAFHALHQRGGAVVADLQAALDVAGGGLAVAGDDGDGVVVEVGAAAPGRVLPIAGANFYLLKDNPDAALAKAGVPAVEAWRKTCKTDSKSCVAAMQAMTGQALATVKTDAAGNAALPPRKPGNYYLFGLAPYEGKSLIWHRPVGVSPGPNNVFLDHTNATAG